DWRPKVAVTQSEGEGTIRLWNLTTRSQIASPITLDGRPSPDGRWLAAVSADDNTVKLWDLSFPANPAQVLPENEKGDSKQQARFSFSGNSHWLQVVQGNVVRLWNLAPARPVPLDLGTVKSPGTFRPDGRWVAAVSADD